MARSQIRIRRKVGTYPVTAAGFATAELPRDYDYDTIFVRLTGSVQVTTAFTSVRAEAPCQAVPRMEVLADGKNSLFSAPFWFASLASNDRPLTHQGSRVTTPPSAASIATYAVEAIGTIDFSSIDCVRPKDSIFRSNSLSIFQLRMTFGQAADMFVGAGVAAFSNLNVEVWAVQTIEVPDATGSITSPTMMKKVSYQEQALLASNANLDIRLPAGNVIKEVMVRTDGLTTAGEPSAGVINNVTLQAGIDVRWNLTGPQTRAANNADYGALPLGYYFLDVTRNGAAVGLLTEMWDVGSNLEPKVTLDVVGGANVRAQVVTTEYIVI